MSNPFDQSMVKLQVPPGMGSSISIAGFTISAEEDGSVTVPVVHAPILRAHGLKDFVEPPAKAEKK